MHKHTFDLTVPMMKSLSVHPHPDAGKAVATPDPLDRHSHDARGMEKGDCALDSRASDSRGGVDSSDSGAHAHRCAMLSSDTKMRHLKKRTLRATPVPRITGTDHAALPPPPPNEDSNADETACNTYLSTDTDVSSTRTIRSEESTSTQENANGLFGAADNNRGVAARLYSCTPKRLRSIPSVTFVNLSEPDASRRTSNSKRSVSRDSGSSDTGSRGSRGSSSSSKCSASSKYSGSSYYYGTEEEDLPSAYDGPERSDCSSSGPESVAAPDFSDSRRESVTPTSCTPKPVPLKSRNASHGEVGSGGNNKANTHTSSDSAGRKIQRTRKADWEDGSAKPRPGSMSEVELLCPHCRRKHNVQRYVHCVNAHYGAKLDRLRQAMCETEAQLREAQQNLAQFKDDADVARVESLTNDRAAQGLRNELKKSAAALQRTREEFAWLQQLYHYDQKHNLAQMTGYVLENELMRRREVEMQACRGYEALRKTQQALCMRSKATETTAAAAPCISRSNTYRNEPRARTMGAFSSLQLVSITRHKSTDETNASDECAAVALTGCTPSPPRTAAEAVNRPSSSSSMVCLGSATKPIAAEQQRQKMRMMGSRDGLLQELVQTKAALQAKMRQQACEQRAALDSLTQQLAQERRRSASLQARIDAQSCRELMASEASARCGIALDEAAHVLQELVPCIRVIDGVWLHSRTHDGSCTPCTASGCDSTEAMYANNVSLITAEGAHSCTAVSPVEDGKSLLSSQMKAMYRLLERYVTGTPHRPCQSRTPIEPCTVLSCEGAHSAHYETLHTQLQSLQTSVDGVRSSLEHATQSSAQAQASAETYLLDILRCQSTFARHAVLTLARQQQQQNQVQVRGAVVPSHESIVGMHRPKKSATATATTLGMAMSATAARASLSPRASAATVCLPDGETRQASSISSSSTDGLSNSDSSSSSSNASSISRESHLQNSALQPKQPTNAHRPLSEDSASQQPPAHGTGASSSAAVLSRAALLPPRSTCASKHRDGWTVVDCSRVHGMSRMRDSSKDTVATVLTTTPVAGTADGCNDTSDNHRRCSITRSSETCDRDDAVLMPSPSPVPPTSPTTSAVTVEQTHGICRDAASPVRVLPASQILPNRATDRNVMTATTTTTTVSTANSHMRSSSSSSSRDSGNTSTNHNSMQVGSAHVAQPRTSDGNCIVIEHRLSGRRRLTVRQNHAPTHAPGAMIYTQYTIDHTPYDCHDGDDSNVCRA